MNHVDAELDNLLDEVESRYILSPSKSPVPYSEKPRQEEIDIEVEMLLEDINQIENSPPSRKLTSISHQITQHKPINKCDQLYLAGTKRTMGKSSNFILKACDNIRCTSCDFSIISIDNRKWTQSTDYLFFRNHMPDKLKLISETKLLKGSRAYACQCTWISVQDILKVTDNISLKFKWLPTMDTEGFIIELQSVLRGYLKRRDIIQNVRKEYNDVFMEIENELTNNSVSWPSSKSLCYPTVSQTQEYQINNISAEVEDLTQPNEIIISTRPIQDTSDVSLQESIIASPITTMDASHTILQEYPSDRDELLKLRGQLSFELLWVKQAIQSRIQYLQALSQMQY
ncbi:hypothetical protein LOD99_14270 [Oopsacas minuta]|uniref:Cilia- and flagella-associated protein 418 n=1 Tax=Oopsacas minuta TaxID=111878 RepID=A0AAV7KGD0_9METZ|nr:hypothetical protein LOD99_14270 [Oopsacas minuta]